MVSEIKQFYSTEQELEKTILSLPLQVCPRCHSLGNLVLHGYLRGVAEDNSGNRVIRGRRFRCSPRYGRNGCGKTMSILSAGYLRGFVVSCATIWGLLTGVFDEGRSMRAAFQDLKTDHCSSTPYRLLRRLRRGLSQIRTALHRAGFAEDTSSDPPDDTISALVLDLKRLFPSDCPIKSYQQRLQRSFL